MDVDKDPFEMSPDFDPAATSSTCNLTVKTNQNKVHTHSVSIRTLQTNSAFSFITSFPGSIHYKKNNSTFRAKPDEQVGLTEERILPLMFR